MTEADWVESDRPTVLLSFAAGQTPKVLSWGGGFLSGRKLRLALAACCRRHWSLLAEVQRAAVETAERFADGAAMEAELKQADRAAHEQYGAMLMPPLLLTTAPAEHSAAGAVIQICDPVASLSAVHAAMPNPNQPPGIVADIPLMALANVAAQSVAAAPGAPARQEAYRAEFQAQASLLRCICGNPFRPVTIHPEWLTPVVVSLATAAHTERDLPSGHLDPRRLEVLCDALEEAGCAGPEVREHLRGSRPHVRGCWVIDLVLGK